MIIRLKHHLHRGEHIVSATPAIPRIPIYDIDDYIGEFKINYMTSYTSGVRCSGVSLDVEVLYFDNRYVGDALDFYPVITHSFILNYITIRCTSFQSDVFCHMYNDVLRVGPYVG